MERDNICGLSGTAFTFASTVRKPYLHHTLLNIMPCRGIKDMGKMCLLSSFFFFSQDSDREWWLCVSANIWPCFDRYIRFRKQNSCTNKIHNEQENDDRTPVTTTYVVVFFILIVSKCRISIYFLCCAQLGLSFANTSEAQSPLGASNFVVLLLYFPFETITSLR